MGNDISSLFGAEKKKKKKEKGQRYYKPPDKRKKERFDPEENLNFTSQHDASIDKYDYLLVFPLTEGAYVNPKERIPGESSYYSWDVVRDFWSQATPGSEEDKKIAVEKLAKYWKKRLGKRPDAPPEGNEGTELLWVACQTVFREAIIETLTMETGLQVKLTSNGSVIMCRIRAPLRLLELQADKSDYKLQLKGEIDPGSDEFWNKEVYKKLHGRESKPEPVALEIDEERVIYTREEANEILDKLFRAGKLSPNDMTVNPDFETPQSFSRRVHALERIADKVPIFNRYCAYANFTSKPTLRYLFQLHPSVRGKTLFRAKDRLFLTRSILDEHFDFEKLRHHDIVGDFFPLHDSNRGDQLNKDVLSRRWVTFWRASAREAGSPLVSDAAYEPDVEVWFYERPFAQPLSDIRDYFGEKIALYFAWLGLYSYFLLIPSILGGLMVTLYNVRGYEFTTGNVDWFLVVFAILMAMWSSVCRQSWERESVIISIKWGTKGFEDEESDRPQFMGDEAEPVKRSAVTSENETYYPEEKRFWIMAFNLFIVFIVTVLDLGIFGGISYAEYLVYTQYTFMLFPYFSWAVAVFTAIMIEVCSRYYDIFARMLTDNENHRTQTDYEDALVAKTLAFRIFNNYGILIATSFLKRNTNLLGQCVGSCIDDVKQLLWAIFILRNALKIWELVYPSVSYYIGTLLGDDGKPKAAGGGGGGENQALNEPDYFSSEMLLTEYEGTFQDYAEVVIQFGYVTLYSVVLPYLSLIALGENLLKMRMDAWKLCTFMKRPHVLIAEDVGGWAMLMQIVSILGAINSVGIIVFAEDEFINSTFYEKLIIFLVAEQVLLMLMSWVESLMPTVPDWVDKLDRRNKYIVEKFVMGFSEDNTGLDLSKVKGNLDDTIDLDSIDFMELRKNKLFYKECRFDKENHPVYLDVVALETKRRVMLKDLANAKEELQEVYKAETFNDNTGIGETKKGLPLGRITVRLGFLHLPPKEFAMLKEKPQLRLRVTIRPQRSDGPPAGPPIGPLNYFPDELQSEVLFFEPHVNTYSFNQKVLGPYAPIRTIHADLVFDFLDMRPGAIDKSGSPEIIATGSIRLKKLDDQKDMTRSIPLKIRQDGDLKVTEADLQASVYFQFSKVAPIRAKIFDIQNAVRAIEREIALMKAEKKNDVDPTVAKLAGVKLLSGKDSGKDAGAEAADVVFEEEEEEEEEGDEKV